MCLRASFGAFGTKRRESMYQNVSYMLLQHQNQYGSNSWKIYQHFFFIFLLFLKNCPKIGIKRDFLIFNQNVHDILSNVISLENERSDFFSHANQDCLVWFCGKILLNGVNGRKIIIVIYITIYIYFHLFVPYA